MADVVESAFREGLDAAADYIERIGDYGSENRAHSIRMIDMPDDLRARLSQAGAGGVVVWPLRWEQPDGPDGTAWLGHGTDWCQYYIRLDDDGTYLMPGDRQSSDDDDSAEEYRTLEEAQAAAQQDYQRRILSALAASPSAGEPVAWVQPGYVSMLQKYGNCSMRAEPVEALDYIVPLYATPPAPVPTASVEAVEPEMMEALYDKIEGLEADLESAVEVAFRRGAAEWTRINHPTLYTRLNAASLAPAPGEGMAEMGEIARIVSEWRHGPMLSPEALRQIAALATPSSPVSSLSPAGGVREAATELLSHLKLNVLDRLTDDDALRDRMYDLTAALSSPATPEPVSAPAGEVGPFGAVMDEVRRATAKFPTWPTDPLHALAVLGEEFGELTRETLQLTYEPHKSTIEDFRKEAHQTAAMALRFLASLHSYQFTPGQQHQQAALNPAPGHGEGGL